jgi:hypothetical protein
MKLSQLTNSELGTLRARDLIVQHHTEMNKVSSALSLVFAATCDRALSKGDIKGAQFFFDMAINS